MSKYPRRSKQRREEQRVHDAELFRYAFNMGIEMGIKIGKMGGDSSVSWTDRLEQVISARQGETCQSTYAADD